MVSKIYEKIVVELLFKKHLFFIIVKGYWDILLIQYGALFEYF